MTAMNQKLAMLLFPGFVYLTGCATESLFVDLIYPPDSEVEIDVVEVADLERIEPRSRNVALDVQDQRENPQQLGLVNTGLIGEQYSYLLTDDNVLVWVHDAIAVELSTLGYNIIDAGSSEADLTSDTLSVNIISLESICYAYCKADVILEATLGRKSQDLISAEFSGEASKAALFSRWPPMAAESLGRAMQSSIKQMLQEFGYVHPNE